MFRLESSYAQRWLSLCLDAGLKKVVTVTIGQVRELMLVDENDYSQKSDLVKRVVYGPVDEINLNTIYQLKYSYLYNRRRPIEGFHLVLFEKHGSGPTMGEFIAPGHFSQICREYGIPGAHMMVAGRHPLIVAALFQADRDIKSRKVIIVKSHHHYMLKVIENSLEYLEPILKFR